MKKEVPVPKCRNSDRSAAELSFCEHRAVFSPITKRFELGVSVMKPEGGFHLGEPRRCREFGLVDLQILVLQSRMRTGISRSCSAPLGVSHHQDSKITSIPKPQCECI